VSEEHPDKARALKEKFVRGAVDLTTPTLSLYEAVKALRFHSIVRLSAEELASALAAIRQLVIVTEPSDRSISALRRD